MGLPPSGAFQQLPGTFYPVTNGGLRQLPGAFFIGRSRPAQAATITSSLEHGPSRPSHPHQGLGLGVRPSQPPPGSRDQTDQDLVLAGSRDQQDPGPGFRDHSDQNPDARGSQQGRRSLQAQGRGEEHEGDRYAEDGHGVEKGGTHGHRSGIQGWYRTAAAAHHRGSRSPSPQSTSALHPHPHAYPHPHTYPHPHPHPQPHHYLHPYPYPYPHPHAHPHLHPHAYLHPRLAMGHGPAAGYAVPATEAGSGGPVRAWQVFQRGSKESALQMEKRRQRRREDGQGIAAEGPAASGAEGAGGKRREEARRGKGLLHSWPSRFGSQVVQEGEGEGDRRGAQGGEGPSASWPSQFRSRAEEIIFSAAACAGSVLAAESAGGADAGVGHAGRTWHREAEGAGVGDRGWAGAGGSGGGGAAHQGEQGERRSASGAAAATAGAERRYSAGAAASGERRVSSGMPDAAERVVDLQGGPRLVIGGGVASLAHAWAAGAGAATGAAGADAGAEAQPWPGFRLAAAGAGPGAARATVALVKPNGKFRATRLVDGTEPISQVRGGEGRGRAGNREGGRGVAGKHGERGS